MVSTTNTATTSFTEIFAETLTDNIFHEIILPLSAYNGQSIYIAIRHWNFTNMFYLSLDDFSIDFSSNISSSEMSSASVYPNPTFNALYIKNANNPVVNIYNTLGELVLSSTKTSIDISTLSQGLYVVKVIENNKETTTQINIMK